MPAYKLITFDAYTALFDRDSGVVPVLSRTLDRSIEDSKAMMQLWRAKQMECAALSNSLQKGRTSFRDATRLGLHYVARRFGLDLSDAQQDELVHAWDRLQPWPEAEQVLAEIKSRGYPIGILSNGDEAMLQALAGRVATPFDHIFSSEKAGFYKPHPSVYHLPLAALNLAGEEVLHVAGGAPDALGATAAGLACAWSNRDGDAVLDPAYTPDFTFRNLEGLLTIL